ncbi:MAG: RraA family protein [Candidatus Aminicenantes bacterium]|nr:RraA family protein [Candidatus Aminicenantes bacterium]
MIPKILCILMICPLVVYSQRADPEQLEKGVNFIQVPAYSQEENTEILKLYDGLRVADVKDALDRIGLQDVGLVNPEIQAAWKDLKTLRHQFRGIALTVRYVPSNLPNRPEAKEDFESWEGHFYETYSSEAFVSIIKPGHVIVIDDVEEADIGSIGSYNILDWYARGALGVVTDAHARDTDEIAIEQVPLYFRGLGRGMRPGRNMLESINRPVSIGGVLVCPGDVVVADGDGVVVVPRRVAESVAAQAKKILDMDKDARRSLYKKLGKRLDKTVKK